ncbi:SAM-dependent methyltransferase [Actinomadura rudentiformis]|uniref:SAM-dependent methyltransferase n=2 Tax=Actinomadura rudentiformis TaxID=359158 RepID=A0A6H9YU88_9ACTN|nr:SAM-dependent methyltransferase [Actinomadura rudentiformis]
MVTAAGPGWTPASGGTDLASPARMYDYLLGGKDNYAADRDLTRRLLEIQPQMAVAARENRAFLTRAVDVLAERGIRQFLDLGCGLPTRENVHQIAARRRPGARVVYVDHDPIVLAHARALLTDDGNVAIVQSDLRKRDELLGDVDASGSLDWAEPVAVLLTAVLHFVADADDPAGILAGLRAELAPGSALVISHATAGTAAEAARAAELYATACVTPLALRGRDEIAEFFGDFELLEPGLVFTAEWQPQGGTPSPAPTRGQLLAGVGLRR